MLNTSSDLLNVIIAIFVYSWIVSILFGLVLSISYPVFKKANREGAGIFIPIYNLFELCALNGYDEKYGFIFLIPIVNVIMIMVMSYKLKDSFSTNGAFNIGLLLLPGIFVPMLAYGNVLSSNEEEEEEIVEEKKVPEAEVKDIDVDSIFKTPSQTKEVDNKPYKAKKVQVNEKFINSAPAEQEKIEKL